MAKQQSGTSAANGLTPANGAAGVTSTNGLGNISDRGWVSLTFKTTF